MNADLAFLGAKRMTAICAGKPAKADFSPVDGFEGLRMGKKPASVMYRRLLAKRKRPFREQEPPKWI
jgi:hypothetical protein